MAANRTEGNGVPSPEQLRAFYAARQGMAGAPPGEPAAGGAGKPRGGPPPARVDPTTPPRPARAPRGRGATGGGGVGRSALAGGPARPGRREAAGPRPPPAGAKRGGAGTAGGPARRFSRGGGPATIAQLAWWTGLGVKAAR